MARWPWSSIGRLVSSAGSCTGTLIASDRVLTAAHCLWDRKARIGVEPKAVLFELGYDSGASTGRAHARRFVVDAALRGPHGTLLENREPSRDWAVLVLDAPLDQLPIRLSEPTVLAATAVMLPGYGRSPTLLLHKDCMLLARQGGMLRHRCDSLPGTSGGPILAFQGGDPRPVIIGVHVSWSTYGGYHISNAVAVRDQIIDAARHG